MTDNAQIETMARKILEGVAAYANNSNKPVDPYDVKLQDDNALADTAPSGNKNITIRQSNSNHNQNNNLSTNNIPNNALYVLNGELKNKSDIEKIDPENIKSIDILKGESAAKFYGDKGKNGVIIITTKDFNPITTIDINTKGEIPLYVVDGNFINAEQLKTSVNQDDILSVNVLKGEQATKAYGDHGKNGVIEITTKNATRKGNGIIRNSGFETQKLLLFGNPAKC
jgi:TonB-dependent SusC/RagA subfamily outer membrane receptor